MLYSYRILCSREKTKLLLYTIIWMTLTDIIMREWTQAQHTATMWFHLCDIQKQAKLSNDNRSQNSGYILVVGMGERWVEAGIDCEET